MTTLQVGDIVASLDPQGDPLRSGSEWYSQAVVVELKPFTMVSPLADMMWSTWQPGRVIKVGTAKIDVLLQCMRRIKPDVTLEQVCQLLGTDPPAPTHDAFALHMIELERRKQVSLMLKPHVDAVMKEFGEFLRKLADAANGGTYRQDQLRIKVWESLHDMYEAGLKQAKETNA